MAWEKTPASCYCGSLSQSSSESQGFLRASLCVLSPPICGPDPWGRLLRSGSNGVFLLPPPPVFLSFLFSLFVCLSLLPCDSALVGMRAGLWALTQSLGCPFLVTVGPSPIHSSSSVRRVPEMERSQLLRQVALYLQVHRLSEVRLSLQTLDAAPRGHVRKGVAPGRKRRFSPLTHTDLFFLTFLLLSLVSVFVLFHCPTSQKGVINISVHTCVLPVPASWGD